jgi:hypothetical protein
MKRAKIQALGRSQPGLPIKPGRCQTMTHDYKLKEFIRLIRESTGADVPVWR